MKFIICVALIALVSADEKKPLTEAEKKPEQKPEHGLSWPLPDPSSEGDLLLHGNINFERVRSLHKIKVEEDVDKMILAHGRRFLRRVATFFDQNAAFKIMPVLCRDSRNLNNTNRWRIELGKQEPAADAAKAPAAVGGEKEEAPKEKAQKDDPIPKTEELRSNVTTNAPEGTPISTIAGSKPTDKPLVTEKPVEEGKDEYEVRRREFYHEVGTNFARLLMKEYHKEQLIKEETDYLARWISDEAVHIGASAIYCNEGEDVKEIKKQLVAFLDEKQQ